MYVDDVSTTDFRLLFFGI